MYQLDKIGMTKTYILLLMHFLGCILVFTLEPYVSGGNVIPYGLIGTSLCITALLTSWLFLRFPTERLNPFALLSSIYSIQFSLSLYLVKYHKLVSRNELMRHYNNIDESNLVDALKYTYIFSFIVLSFAFVFARSSLWARILSLVNKELLKKGMLLSFFTYGITILEFLLIATGKVTLQGESMLGKDVENIEVNPLVAIVNPIACLAVFLSAYLYSRTKDKKLIFLLIIQFVWFFLWGRRQIVFFTFLAFVGFYYNTEISIGRLTKGGFRKILLAAILFMIVTTAAQFYQQLRTIGGVAVLQNVTITSLQKVLKMYWASDNSELRHASEFNIEIRALSTVAAVAHYDKLLETGGVKLGDGLEIYNNLLKATPSNYFVNKASVPVMEALASELTGGKIRSNRDLGGSLILESMIDYGRFGVLVYPVFIAIMIIIFYWVLLKIGNPFAMFWFVIALVYSILSMLEGSLGDMFLAMRSTLLVIGILTFLRLARIIFLSWRISIARNAV